MIATYFVGHTEATYQCAWWILRNHWILITQIKFYLPDMTSRPEHTHDPHTWPRWAKNTAAILTVFIENTLPCLVYSISICNFRPNKKISRCLTSPVIPRNFFQKIARKILIWKNCKPLPCRKPIPQVEPDFMGEGWTDHIVSKRKMHMRQCSPFKMFTYIFPCSK